MGRVIVTGDKHAESRTLFNLDLLVNNFTKEDLVIVLGDFGFIWNKNKVVKNLEALGSQLNYTLCFLDGNHENFPLISSLEKIIEWNGGRAGLLPGGIIHLLRGEIYQINGKTIGVCGGAISVDQEWRTEGKSWWAQEDITLADIANFEHNFERLELKKIDIMLSHTCPASILHQVAIYSVANGSYVPVRNPEALLEKINILAKPTKWYFGHWHIDMKFDEKYECLYFMFEEI